MDIQLQDVLALLGQKEVEIAILRREIASAREQIRQLMEKDLKSTQEPIAHHPV